MPKSKSAKRVESSSSSDSDSGPDDRTPAKKMKSTTKLLPTKKNTNRDDNEELSWDLGKNRFVKLTEFKGKWYVNIREFYLADGDLKPGKKGIMLTMEQWQKFKGILGELDDAIKQNV